MKRRRRDSQDGYALIEAIAALLIASLAFLMIATAAAILARSTERTVTETNAGEVLIAGTATFRREVLAAIDPAALGIEDEEESGSFRGSARAIRFVAAPGGLDGGREEVTIRAEGNRLLRESSPLAAENPFRGAAPLIEGPWTYRFEFAGHDEPGWQPSWRDPKSLPKAIRLKISGRGGEVATVAVRLLTDPQRACAPEEVDCAQEEDADAAL